MSVTSESSSHATRAAVTSPYAQKMNDLERQVVERILMAEAASYPGLISHLEALAVNSRRYTGVGVYTDFRPTTELEPCRSCPTTLRLGGKVVGYVGAQELLAGFVLYVDEGIITTLESFVYDGQWPTTADQHFRLE